MQTKHQPDIAKANVSNDIFGTAGCSYSHPKVSIIVPVYNVERYIRQCIESVLAQTFSDYECILVDDCSPDGTPVICDEYAQKDGRIRVIHKIQNEGLPQARETGFKNSTGEYILYIDSDDWIEPKMLERLYQLVIAEKFDIVYCDAVDFEEGETSSVRVRKLFDVRNMGKEGIICSLIKYDFDCAVWNKLFKRELFQGLVFPKFQKWEDAVICVQLFLNAATVGYEYSIMYHHRLNPGSLTLKDDASNRKRRADETRHNWHEIQEILTKRDDYSKYKNAIEWQLNNLPYQKLSMVQRLKRLIVIMLPPVVFLIYGKLKTQIRRLKAEGASVPGAQR